MDYKNILILLDPDENELKNWLKKELVNEEHNYIFLEVDELEMAQGKIILADLVLNFLNPEREFFEPVQKILEAFKINYFGNNLLNQKFFEIKPNLKKFLEVSEWKTPVFENLSKKSPNEVFVNFPQPSRIFSRENNYFTGKIETLSEMQKNFHEIQKKDELNKFYIEEFIDGEEASVFIYKNIFDELSFVFSKNFPETEKKQVEKIFNIFDLKDFAFLNFLNSKKRGFYITSFALSLYGLYKKRERLSEIFEENHLNFPGKIFEKDLF